MQKKLISILLILVLVVNMILLGLRKIPTLGFWIITGIIGLFAYKILPKMKN